jgi:predicted DNA-binding transcriptional regulator YafY
VRASRLLSLLLLLQTRGRMTAHDLADALEVSVRTIYRDVEALHAAGIPLYGDPGHAGGYQLLGGYRTRLTGLTAAEAETLFLAGLPGPAAELGLGGILAAATLKLRAALPQSLRDNAARLSERFLLDAPGWYQRSAAVPYLSLVAGAVWDRQVIEVRYRRWKEPAEVVRRIEPYGLVLKGGTWYVVARSDGSLRTYRVDQIASATGCGQAFEPLPGFDLEQYWRGYLADFHDRLHTGSALVRVSPAGLRRMDGILSDAATTAIRHGGRTGPDGWVTAQVPIESAARAAGDLLRLGADVEVLGPAEVRDQVADAVRALAALYRTHPYAGAPLRPGG